MSLIEFPDISFDNWRRWDERPRPSHDYEVPYEFGILGIYILAAAELKPGNSVAPNPKDLPQEVLYIGMSTHVDSRLEKHHMAVSRYKAEYSDASCQNLWFSTWLSDWTNTALSKRISPVAEATLAFYERGIILMYVRKFECLPALNRK